MKLYYFCTLILLPLFIWTQNDSIKQGLQFSSDFRFRTEQDWNSKKADGSLREDRTRFRYRARACAKYNFKNYEVAFGLRTGAPNKQQDPQLTLGDGYKEFGTLPIGIDKAYFKVNWRKFSFGWARTLSRLKKAMNFFGVIM